MGSNKNDNFEMMIAIFQEKMKIHIFGNISGLFLVTVTAEFSADSYFLKRNVKKYEIWTKVTEFFS